MIFVNMRTYIVSMYTYVHNMSCVLSAAGMSLIAKHAAQFKEYLAKDHEVTLLNFTSAQGSQLSSLLQCVYNCLMAWAKHNTLKTKMILGMATNWSTLKTFLSQIGEFVELEVDHTVGTVLYTGGGGGGGHKF